MELPPDANSTRRQLHPTRQLHPDMTPPTAPAPTPTPTPTPAAGLVGHLRTPTPPFVTALRSLQIGPCARLLGSRSQLSTTIHEHYRPTTATLVLPAKPCEAAVAAGSFGPTCDAFDALAAVAAASVGDTVSAVMCPGVSLRARHDTAAAAGHTRRSGGRGPRLTASPAPTPTPTAAPSSDARPTRAATEATPAPHRRARRPPRFITVVGGHTLRPPKRAAPTPTPGV